MSDILYRVEEHVATITLNRPEKLNAFRLDHIAEIERLVLQTADDPHVRVVVITGTGRAFSAGGDVSVLGQGGATAGMSDDDAWSLLRHGAQHTIEVIRSARPVTVAAINGVCAGGALALACAADLRVAARSSRLTTAFAHVGQPADMGLPWTLTRLLGSARAAELMLLSDMIDAEHAERVGLVNRVYDDTRFTDEVSALTMRLAGFAPLALQAMKKNLVDSQQFLLARYLDAEITRYVDNSRTEDSREATHAFLERRPPRYAAR